MEGADCAIGAADDDHLVGADPERDITARFRELASRDRVEPVLVEYVLEIEVVDFGRGVERLLKGIARATAREQVFDGGRWGRHGNQSILSVFNSAKISFAKALFAIAFFFMLDYFK